MKLLVVISYHIGDLEITKKLLEWCAELRQEMTPPKHPLLLVADASVSREEMNNVKALASGGFDYIKTLIITVPKERQGWPSAAQMMFLQAAKYVQDNFKLDFLWLEPDAIPLSPGWLDLIAMEHYESPKKYLGCVVKQDKQPELPKEHLSGCAVYPNDAYDTFSKIESVVKGTNHWDIAGASVVVPATKHSELFQCYWGTVEMPPVFVKEKTAESPKNHVTLSFLREGAVLFHRSKDGGLISILQEARTQNRNGQAQELVENTTETPPAIIFRTGEGLGEMAPAADPEPVDKRTKEWKMWKSRQTSPATTEAMA